MPDTETDMVTIAQAAAVRGVGVSTVARWIREGRLPSVVGRSPHVRGVRWVEFVGRADVLAIETQTNGWPAGKARGPSPRRGRNLVPRVQAVAS